MIVNKELAESKGHLQKDLWETPQDLFDKLHEKYDFTLDPCCTQESAKCYMYFTPEEDGLKRDWSKDVCFVNPPYSRGNIDKWMKKCFEEAQKGARIVALVPVSTSSKWFHSYVWNHARIEFIKGRIRFKGAPFTAPFSSMLVFYNL